jgi:hypothetical protein
MNSTEGKESKMIRLIYCLLIVLVAATVDAQTRTNTVKRIRTLPMVKLGDTPPSVKGVQSLPIQARPPKVDPYEWIVVPETATNTANWALSNGTTIAATLVKFNRYTAVFLPNDERERQYSRKALNQEGQQRINEFEKQNLEEIVKVWNEKQAAKQAEKDLAPPK